MIFKRSSKKLLATINIKLDSQHFPFRLTDLWCVPKNLCKIVKGILLRLGQEGACVGQKRKNDIHFINYVNILCISLYSLLYNVNYFCKYKII